MARALRVEDPPGSGRYKAARLRGRAATTDCAECCGDPRGACCFGNGSCAPGLTESECVAQGGQWMGSGSSCSPNPCPPGPCQPQGPHLVVCGFFSHASLVAGTRNIAAWDGFLWRPLAGGFDRAVTCAAVVNGELWVAGNFRLTFDSPTDTVGRPCFGVARWVCDRWEQVGQGIGDTTGFESVMSIGRRLVPATGGPAVFETIIGGNFSRDGNGVALKGLARWTGSAWVQQFPFAGFSGGYVRSVAAFNLMDAQTIVNAVNNGAIGGSFANLQSGLCNNVAQFSGLDVYAGSTGARGVNGEAFSVHHWGALGQDQLLVCGTHSSAVGVSSEHTQRVTLLSRDDANPHYNALPVTQGVNLIVSAAFRSPTSGLWYIGGTFTQKIAYSPSPSFPAGALRRIGRSADGFPRGWEEIGGGFSNGDVRAVTEWRGEIYAGGTFAPLPGGPRGVARLSGSGLGAWQDLHGGVFGQVQALIGYDFMLSAPRGGEHAGCKDCGGGPLSAGGGLLGA